MILTLSVVITTLNMYLNFIKFYSLFYKIKKGMCYEIIRPQEENCTLHVNVVSPFVKSLANN